ncbi:MAG: exodeoxyribonuclease VII large subunit [Desulfobacterales bacterium]|nr:exodeoxyribonuclease VII large subunit [Desulfobacterales bacterium]
MMTAAEKNTGKIYTVGSLTKEIKSLLENRYPFLWIAGEISNYVTPASGHSYFSLKDSSAVISCVMFKNQKRHLRFTPENGMKVKGMARISLYEPRGSYQLIFEHLEPEGVGSLQQEFDRLKEKLAAYGWFDSDVKKTIPFLPSRIHVITSGTGAAVRDIIQVAQRRCPSVPLEIVPVKVQGETAEFEIADAINLVNQMGNSDVIILARGGGSIEDLWAFNTETVAKAVYDSKLPVICGVGHEIDFTIADFVADLRAPTPSAAAELALPDQAGLVRQIKELESTLTRAMEKRLLLAKERVLDLNSRLKSPSRVIDDFRFRIEDNQLRLDTAIKTKVVHFREKLFWLKRTLENTLPLTRIEDRIQYINKLGSDFDLAMQNKIDTCRNRVCELTARLESLNPASVLDRGYSITRKLPEQSVVMDADQVCRDDRVEIILSKGRLVTRVE